MPDWYWTTLSVLVHVELGLFCLLGMITWVEWAIAWWRGPSEKADEFVAYIDAERRLDDVIDHGRRVIIQRAQEKR